MTPEEHYLEAERWLARADEPSTPREDRAERTARAHVHALLATVNRRPVAAAAGTGFVPRARGVPLADIPDLPDLPPLDLPATSHTTDDVGDGDAEDDDFLDGDTAGWPGA